MDVAENRLVRCRKLTNFQDIRKIFCSKYLLLCFFPPDIEHALSNLEDAGFIISLNQGMLWLFLEKKKKKKEMLSIPSTPGENTTTARSTFVIKE